MRKSVWILRHSIQQTRIWSYFAISSPLNWSGIDAHWRMPLHHICLIAPLSKQNAKRHFALGICPTGSHKNSKYFKINFKLYILHISRISWSWNAMSGSGGTLQAWHGTIGCTKLCNRHSVNCRCTCAKVISWHRQLSLHSMLDIHLQPKAASVTVPQCRIIYTINHRIVTEVILIK